MSQLNAEQIANVRSAFRAAVTARLSDDGIRASDALRAFDVRGDDMDLMQGVAASGITWAANLCIWASGVLDCTPLEAWQAFIEIDERGGGFVA